MPASGLRNSLPSQGRRITSYRDRVAGSDQRLAAGGLPPSESWSGGGFPCGVTYMWIRPPASGRENSCVSSPILRRRHSNGSAEPVAMASCGMSPSLLFRGSRCWFTSVSVVVVHAGTAGMVT